jgi:hypothetical protein
MSETALRSLHQLSAEEALHLQSLLQDGDAGEATQQPRTGGRRQILFSGPAIGTGTGATPPISAIGGGIAWHQMRRVHAPHTEQC